MFTKQSTVRFATLAAFALLGATLVVAGTTPAPREAMIRILGSPGPDPALGGESETFDRLVGSWDADFGFPQPDGTVRHKKGELHFGWVMDGTAIQDLWISYPTEAGKERSVGTTLRFFDKKSGVWNIVFINPRFNYVVTAQGRREGPDIVFRGTDTDGRPLRWTFSEISATSFHWQGEKSYDDGKTWRVEEDHHMTRRSALSELPAGATATAAFDEMKALLGDWKTVQDGVPVTETYTLTANGSAIMAETRPASQPVMITMFTADGDHLIATHYCSAGNQPQMVAANPGTLGSGIAFTLERVTGLKTAGDWHNTGISIALDDANHMTQTWTWAYKGKTGTTVFHYTRAKS